MAHIHCTQCTTSRREMLRAGLFGIGVRSALPAIFGHTSLAIAAQAFQGGGEAHPERILVVVELTGGNDGLDTVIPYSNDDYQRARPTLGLKANGVLKLGLPVVAAAAPSLLNCLASSLRSKLGTL